MNKGKYIITITVILDVYCCCTGGEKDEWGGGGHCTCDSIFVHDVLTYCSTWENGSSGLSL